jgi:hypothetical protein
MKRRLICMLLMTSVTPALLAFELQVVLKPGANGVAVETSQPSGKVDMPTGENLAVNVTCDGTVKCTDVRFDLRKKGAAENLLASAQGTYTATKALMTIAAEELRAGSFELRITHAAKTIQTIEVTGQTAAEPARTADGNKETLPLLELLTTPCELPGPITYPLGPDTAWVVATPVGRILSSNLGDAEFDENDRLIVFIIAAAELQDRLSIRRKSPFRDASELRLLGSEITRDQLELHAAEGGCTAVRAELADFAPGRGEVEISVLAAVEKPIVVGSFEFAVNPLYTGMLSFGPTWTKNVDPDYAIAKVGEKNVIVQENVGDRDLKYAVFYTPFIWGRRDLQKSRDWYRAHGRSTFERSWLPWLRHINPSLGFVVDELEDHALVGVTLDLGPGIAFTVGRHFRRREVLQSGLAVGAEFVGEAADLPTGTEWDDEDFVAVSFDLRAAVKALAAVVRSGAK